MASQVEKDLLDLVRAKQGGPGSTGKVYFDAELSAMEAVASVDLNAIPVRSYRPGIGVGITLFKRAVRKATYWMYQPIFQRIATFHHQVIATLKNFGQLENEVLQKLDQSSDQTERLLDQIEELRDQIEDLSGHLARMVTRQQLVQASEDSMNFAGEQIQAVRSETNDLREQLSLILAVKREQLSEIGFIKSQLSRMATLEQFSDMLSQETKNSQEQISRLESAMSDLQPQLPQLETRIGQSLQGYRSETAVLNAKLAILLQKTRDQQPISVEEGQEAESSSSGGTWADESMEMVYHDFENIYRGSESLIRDRQKDYLEEVVKAYQSTGAELLDIGAGRGEFLEICRDAGVPASGIDVNAGMVERALTKGLSVSRRDALSYLAELPDESLGIITAFQIIEHLEPRDLWSLLQHAIVKLKPGGLVILETVNSDCLVALRNFWSDLSHVRPIPPGTLEFIVNMVGFSRVGIRYSGNFADNERLQESDENDRKLNQLLFGPQDYAVLGWR